MGEDSNAWIAELGGQEIHDLARSYAEKYHTSYTVALDSIICAAKRKKLLREERND